MDIKELIIKAQERQYAAFDDKAKEILSAKLAQRLEQDGYKARLQAAKNEPSTEPSEPAKPQE